MRFCDIVGHEKVKNVLKRQCEKNCVGHAYIFEGADGIGKKSLALGFANMLVCEMSDGGTECGVCKSCIMARSGNHPDIRVITNQIYDDTKKTTDILVDTIRNMKQEIYIKPYMSDRKVYIIPKADTMNVYAQNSLLKVLEEPPPYCTLILIAENANLFLQTIRSRAVLLRFSPLEKELVTEYLIRNYPDMPRETADIKAGMSGGSIKRAAALATDDDADRLRGEVIKSITALRSERKKSIYELVRVLKQNKGEINFIIDIMRNVFRDIMYIRVGENSAVVNSDALSELSLVAEFIQQAAPVYMLEILFKYENYFAKNINYAIAVQCMAVELWEVIHDRGYRSKI